MQTIKPKQRDQRCVLVDPNLKDYFCFSFAGGGAGTNQKLFTANENTTSFHPLNEQANLIAWLCAWL